MLKQINDWIINTDSIEQIYFSMKWKLVFRTNTGEETYFYLDLIDEDDEGSKTLSKLNELLHDPRIKLINLNNL
nr:MAG TPA: hypothetical protein [Caudoviricetes sp.]